MNGQRAHSAAFREVLSSADEMRSALRAMWPSCVVPATAFGMIADSIVRHSETGDWGPLTTTVLPNLDRKILAFSKKAASCRQLRRSREAAGYESLVRAAGNMRGAAASCVSEALCRHVPGPPQ